MKELHKQEYIKELVARLADKVLTEEFERYVYGADWSPRTVEEICPPDVVICPRTTQDIANAVKIAYKYEIPVTAGGGLKASFCGLSEDIGKKRIAEAKRTGAEILATACYLCELQFKSIGGIEVRNVFELLYCYFTLLYVPFLIRK
jgi:hypothetical protein